MKRTVISTLLASGLLCTLCSLSAQAQSAPVPGASAGILPPPLTPPPPLNISALQNILTLNGTTVPTVPASLPWQGSIAVFELNDAVTATTQGPVEIFSGPGGDAVSFGVRPPGWKPDVFLVSADGGWAYCFDPISGNYAWVLTNTLVAAGLLS